MLTDGPQLETLTRRLAECPADFLAEPRLGATGAVHVAAVVSDLLCALGAAPLTPAQARRFDSTDSRRDRNRLRLVLVASWLLRDAWFCAHPQVSAAAHTFLADGLTELAELVPAPQVVAEPDRREELARLCLQALGVCPAGETEAQAQDRLATLHSAERRRVVLAARQAEARAREIRDAMAREAAREASLKAMRE